MSTPKLTLVAGDDPFAARSDDELMALASAGRRDAFAALVTRYAARLGNVCAKFVADARLGEELAQETWLQVWQARARYRPDGRFASYLFTVARNRCRNELRARSLRRQQPGAAAPELPSDAPEHLDRLIEAERRRRVVAAMASLSPALREALVFRFVEELDYPEIARVIGRSESAVRSRVHDAVDKLRRALARSGT